MIWPIYTWIPKTCSALGRVYISMRSKPGIYIMCYNIKLYFGHMYTIPCLAVIKNISARMAIKENYSMHIFWDSIFIITALASHNPATIIIMLEFKRIPSQLTKSGLWLKVKSTSKMYIYMYDVSGYVHTA